MGMFSKVIAFLDKAAGVPLWITHADNIRKLDVERGCPTLAKAIVDNKVLWPLASYSLEEMLPQLAGMIARNESVLTKQLVHEIIAAYEGPVGECLQVLYDFVGKDIPDVEIVEVDALSSLAKFAEEVFADSEVTATVEATSTEEVHIPVLDPQVRAQLIHGMTKVISRGRKVGPTLKVLNTMSGGDRAAILEALHIMEARGNSLAKAILEDTSL